MQHRLCKAPAQTLSHFWLQLAQAEQNTAQCMRLLRYHWRGAQQRTLQQTLDWLIEQDYRPVARQHADKLHWILGDNDPLIPITCAATLPGRVTTISGGHLPMLTQPRQLQELIDARSA